MMYFHTCASCSYLFALHCLERATDNDSTTCSPADKSEPPLSVDIVGDIRRLNDLSIKSKKAGMIILGGGVCKHQIANSMLFVRPRSRPFPLALSLPRAAAR